MICLSSVVLDAIAAVVLFFVAWLVAMAIESHGRKPK